MTATFFAMLLVILTNSAPRETVVAPVYEDSPVVASMATLSLRALNETHPECVGAEWHFNVDASDGVSVIATSPACEFAAEFYRAPDTLVWQFMVEGS